MVASITEELGCGSLIKAEASLGEDVREEDCASSTDEDAEVVDLDMTSKALLLPVDEVYPLSLNAAPLRVRWGDKIINGIRIRERTIIFKGKNGNEE